jgi:hypothetical protein
VADTRGNKNDWHSCITLPRGMLKAGKDYVVALDYEVIERSSADTYFYVFGRSEQLGLGADHWQTWHGEPGARGEAKLRISPSANDCVINVGIHNQGAVRIENLKVLPGSGWAALPLTSASGKASMPTPPTGAQAFTVNAPSNPSGPVLNLADFGAVADGSTPSSLGPDRNHAAFVATSIPPCS